MTERGPAAAGLWAIATLLLLLGAVPVAAQVTPKPDTARTPRPDSVEVNIPPAALPADTLPRSPARDTVPKDTVPADSLLPAPNFPRFVLPADSGWSAGVWGWDEAALRSFHDLTLLALLERVPGLVLTRAGGAGYPAGIADLVPGGGRLRVFMDGWEVDPLDATEFDLQRISVADLGAVRVERGGTETRVYLEPFRLENREPRSHIELGTGDLNTRVLRGRFATPVGPRGVLLAAGDIVDTDGWLFREPFNTNTAVFRYSYLFRPETGVQLEYRQNSTTRKGVYPLAFSRRDLVVRGRTRLSPALGVDGVLARSSEYPRGDSLRAADRSWYQVMGRGVLQTRFGRAEAGVRARFGRSDAVAIPETELFARAEAGSVSGLLLGGEARFARAAGVSGAEISVDARTRPVGNVTLFARAATGSRPVGLPRDTLPPDTLSGDSTPPLRFAPAVAFAPHLTQLRSGAEWTRGAAAVGTALLYADADSVAPFALEFDPDSLPRTGARRTGIETYASLPIPRLPVRLRASYRRWTGVQDRAYFPRDDGFASLVYRQRFYDGQLEPSARLALRYRGTSLAPLAGGAAVQLPSYALADFRLEIRIIDVRLFLILENALNDRTALDVPARPLPGAHFLYGVRWDFRN